jgi:hypothetical protein
MNEEKSDMINPGQDTPIIYIQTSIKFSDEHPSVHMNFN